MASGIPPGVGNVTDGLNKGILLVTDALKVKSFFAGSIIQWGIFLNGKLVLAPDSIVSFDMKRDFRIADYPMEEGAFQSYNKVKVPYDSRIRMTKGGGVDARSAFLIDVEKIANSLDLYTITTPEGNYVNVNVQHYDYRREAKHGAGLITVDLWLVEIRQTIAPAFTNTVAPSGSNPANTNTALPASATPAQSSSVVPRVQ